MLDRELLELAAKAIGGSISFGVGVGARGCVLALPNKGEFFWNPLTDDGDALRLAVKLRLTIDIERDRCCISVGDHSGRFGVQHLGGLSWEEATRRAIVRAAAEIGRAMP